MVWGLHLPRPVAFRDGRDNCGDQTDNGENRMAKKPAAAASGSSGDVSKVLKMLSDNSVEYVDLRFTDPRGKWQHTAQHVSTMDEDAFRDGIMFDGSSIAGWKAINESDMILMPDPARRRWTRSRPSRA